jgi:NADPH2:quinone reductase
VRLHAAGGPEVLAVETAPAPVPGPGEVLVAVRFAGVNFADVNVRRATYGPAVRDERGRGLGRDLLGDVVDVGPGVDAAMRGERVAGFSTGPAYAELAVCRHDLVWPVPAGVPDEQAAAFPTVGLTAFHLLSTAGRLRDGEDVLVTAASGGVGTTVVQLAHRLGAGRVVAVAATADRARAALRLGADEAATYDELAVRDAPEPVDLALDGVGGAVRRAVLDRVRPLGRLVHFGNAGGTPEELPSPRAMRERGLGVVGFHLEVLRRAGGAALADSARYLLGLLADGALTIPVQAVLPLEEAPAAHRLLESRQVHGKLLLGVVPAGGDGDGS